MTVEQFNLLHVGDMVIDMACSRRVRTILGIKRIRKCVSLRVTNLKSASGETIIMVSPETGALRFEFP